MDNWICIDSSNAGSTEIIKKVMYTCIQREKRSLESKHFTKFKPCFRITLVLYKLFLFFYKNTYRI